MKKYSLINLIALLMLATNTCYAEKVLTLPFYNSAEFTPHWLDTDSPKLKTFHRIPEFNFTNQDGEKVTQNNLSNKIYVANFFFTTCPGICPMIRSKLSKVQEKFINDDQIKLISHSIRPTTDTKETLKIYAKQHGIQSGKWHLLTGNKNSIYKLAKNAYFANEDLGNIQNTNDFLHTENIVLIDTNKHIRGIYNGLNTASINNLITDIEILKNETNKAGT